MNGPTYTDATPGVLDRATVTARRTAVHAELLAAMQTVERYRGALAILDELLALEEPPT
jgi:hypothetical protein